MRIWILGALALMACSTEIETVDGGAGGSADMSSAHGAGGAGGMNAPDGGAGGELAVGGRGPEGGGGAAEGGAMPLDCGPCGVDVAGVCQPVPDGEPGDCPVGLGCFEGECVPCDEHGFEGC